MVRTSAHAASRSPDPDTWASLRLVGLAAVTVGTAWLLRHLFAPPPAARQEQVPSDQQDIRWPVPYSGATADPRPMKRYELSGSSTYSFENTH